MHEMSLFQLVLSKIVAKFHGWIIFIRSVSLETTYRLVIFGLHDMSIYLLFCIFYNLSNFFLEIKFLLLQLTIQ